MATHSSILAEKSHGKGGWWAIIHGVTESDMTEQLNSNNKVMLTT